MQRFLIYLGFLAGLAIPFLLISGCEREPAVDHEAGMDMNKSNFQSNVVKLDTLIFSNPLHTNGNIRFDLLGTPPQINTGDLIFYPGGEGLFGKVVSVTTIGSRMVFQLEQASLDQVFKNASVQDSVSRGLLKSRIRTDAHPWYSDTLGLDQLYLYKDLWEMKGLEVQFLNGKLFSASSLEQFVLSGQGSDPWFDRFRLDFNYSLALAGDLVIKTGGGLDANDSLLVEKSVYGPFLINGFPVIYQIDTWLGFHVVTERDTVLTLRMSGIAKGTLSLGYNYWETWNLTQNSLVQSADIQSFSGPGYTGYRNQVFVSQVITPYFCGEPSVSLSNRFSVLAGSEVSIPNWQSQQTVSIVGSMMRQGEGFSAYIPARLSTSETLLYSESQSGILQNQRPTAVFVIDPPAGFITTNFKFDASGCSDLESPVENLMVRWDFDGNNDFDTEFSTNKVAYYTYPGHRVYEPILEVRDEGGLISRMSSSVEVRLSTSAPIAHFTVRPESGRISDIFFFDAEASYDAEDPVSQLKVRWDFDGNGTWDTDWSTKKIEYFVFQEEGKYVAKLEVLDTEGLTGSTTGIIYVAPVNIKPTAFFTVYPEVGSTETRFDFDATGCSDPEDSPGNLRVRWDWDNDGTYDTEYRTLKFIQHVFPTPGTYTVVLEVIDTEGYGSTFTREVKVTNPNTPPVADFSITPEKGKVGQEISFDASASTDEEDNPDQMDIRWDWNNDNRYDTPFSLNKVIKKTFTEAGTFIITLQVRDSGGLTDKRVKLLVIE